MATNTETLTIELDIADDETGTAEGANRWARQAARHYHVQAVLVNPSGPGGGWPVWRFTGPEDRLRRLFRHYCGGTPELAGSSANVDAFTEFLV